MGIFKIFFLGLCFFIFLAVVNASESDRLQDKDSERLKIIEDKTGIAVNNNKTLASLYNEAVEWLKTPYRRGGTSHKGMDCSGLTSTIYQNVFGIKLQRRSKDISKEVDDLPKTELKPGDLVFFATSRRGKGINHVGVYLGNNNFVHASCSNGVIISNLNESYYRRTWVKGGRIHNGNSVYQNLYAKQQNPDIKDIKVKAMLLGGDIKSTSLFDHVISAE